MLDLLILVLIVIFVLKGYKVGFFKTCYELSTLIVAMIGTRVLFPIVNRAIMATGVIYEPIKNSIMETLNLQNIITENTIKAQNKLIGNLNLPSFIIEKLNENNNLEIYNILKVSSIEEYISGYIANIVINIVVSIIVFIIIFLILKSLKFSSQVIKRVPILKHFNNILGGVVGFFKGVLIIWIVFVFLTLFIAKYPDSNITNQLENSLIALTMYENNLFLRMALQVFK